MLLSRGVVCFCDILGYKSFLENNDIQTSASIIIEQIAKIDVRIREQICKMLEFESSTRNIGYCFLKNRIDCVIVSDTIILFFNMDQMTDEKRTYHTVSALIVITYILSFIRNMFEIGLPVRGCIDYGDYFIHQSMFAGKIISTCYTESNKLEFAGVMITKECYDYMLKNSQDKLFIDLFPGLIESIDVPVKIKNTENRLIINWLKDMTWSNKKIVLENIESFIFTSMTAYKKNLDGNSIDKYKNTLSVIEEMNKE